VTEQSGVAVAVAAGAGQETPSTAEDGDVTPADPLRLPAAPRAYRSRLGSRAWPLRRSLAVLGVIACLAALVMVGSGALALVKLGDARERVVSQIDPALREASELSAALLSQETGVRGYLIGGDPDLLDPYVRGRAEQDRATAALEPLLAGPQLDLSADLAAVRAAADRWRTGYAEPVIAAVRADRAPPIPAETGRQLFERVRGPLDRLRADLESAAAVSRADLRRTASTLQWVFGLIFAGLVALLVVLAIGLRRVVLRPISDLAAGVRRVADGDFDSEVRCTGPREVVELGADVEAMRRQIVTELAALRAASERLDEQARDLERSNTELEQFAYVASHDLQEPLRKVASFSQLLERRYKGQLDERADQYIAFAVDGAKRMQVLINDLLAFSRVGRLVREHVEVDAADLVDQAIANLSLAVEESGAEITVDDLPRVSGDTSLLTAVFQNLVSNAIKFRGEAPPRIHVGVRDAGSAWEFSVADNGIGIEPEYADRIFVIFQRLHGKEVYPGTGIGLAMCRKIVEYSGGRIWLDTDVREGTTFRFTLPKIEEPAADPEPAAPGPDPTDQPAPPAPADDPETSR
jgi:signal transduction histidine kinase